MRLGQYETAINAALKNMFHHVLRESHFVQRAVKALMKTGASAGKVYVRPMYVVEAPATDDK
jgi:chromosome segregation ATPase